ncbi:MAG: MaoC family dehydratase, partial [Pseudomonadota bacterium]|nr:MaoC family dehydratase [Pseudomonadota bacterium]
VTLTESQMVDFSMQYDPQPIHTDREASKRGIHGDMISSGLQTLGLANRLWIELGLMGENNLGGPGLDNVRWPRPVFAGDTLRTVVEVVAARESKSKPDRGIVTFAFITYNQKDEVVMTYECMDMIRREPKAQS